MADAIQKQSAIRKDEDRGGSRRDDEFRTRTRRDGTGAREESLLTARRLAVGMPKPSNVPGTEARPRGRGAGSLSGGKPVFHYFVTKPFFAL